MRIAVYARVSTDDRGQDPLNQLRQLRAFVAKQSGWRIAHEYVDTATGKNGDRQQFQAMMRDAARHRFDVLLFWSLDRLTREGTFKTLCYLRQLSAAGVKYRSYTEQYLDTLGIWGEAIAGLLATLAQQEQLRISERTKAGIARVRAQRSNGHWGPSRKPLDLARLRKLRAQGLTITEIARRTRLSRALVFRRLNENARDAV
jgi:DNA invertase Pin-like site-specific DNA recombinase